MSRVPTKTVRVAVDTDDATVEASLGLPRNNIWARAKLLELQRGKLEEGSKYQPSSSSNADAIKKAMLEFDRRITKEEDDKKWNNNVNWVLVATQCCEIPKTSTVAELLNSSGLSTRYSGVKFCLADDSCLYIVSFSDKWRYANGINSLMEAMVMFRRSTNDRRLSNCHTNAIAQVDGKRTAPDAAFQKVFPYQPDKNNVHLRAPFIAEFM